MKSIPAMQIESDKTDLAGLNEPSSNQTHLKQISSTNPSPPDKTDQSQLHRHRKPDPYTQANCLSRLFFHWPYALLHLGMQQTIQEQDLPEISQDDSSQHNLLWFEQIWNQELIRVQTLEKEKKTNTRFRPSLLRAVVLSYLKSTWVIQPLLFVSVIARILQAFSLGYLIQNMAEKSSAGYIWATVLALCNCFLFFGHHHVLFITYRKGMQLRSAAIAAIFSKSLRLSSIHGICGVSSGQVMNLVSNDVERLILAAYYGPFIIWGPVFGIGSLISGIHIIGPSFAAGFGLLICIFIPLQFYFSRKFSQLRSNVAVLTDARVTLLSQAVLGVRVMKMNGWEIGFETRLAKARTAEISQILKTSQLTAWNQALYYACNVVISAMVFVVHVASGGVLSTRTVFATITLINAIQLELAKNFSLGVMVSIVFSSSCLAASVVYKLSTHPFLKSC
jgi:ATP-binding cassette subfamily C (CFTR/MRP) protein 4